MVRCPSCASEMKFDRKIRMFVCKNCGLSLSRFELDLLRDKKYDEYERADIVDEYYEWWQSRKK